MLTERPESIPAWDSLDADEKRLFARQMEVYAGFVSYTDHHVGRVIDAALAADPNTLIFYIVGDNGAVGSTLPGYGGLVSLAEDLARIGKLGGPEVPFNQSHAGRGWMGNTPFKYWKTVASHFGGLRAPMVVLWPNKLDRTAPMRSQFTHVTDIVPTIYDAAGLAPPDYVDGVLQYQINGTSLLPILSDADAPTEPRTQYFELLGNRAIYQDGWMASALNALNSPTKTSDNWELYPVEQDFSQANNIADDEPQKLAELVALFDEQARANDVYPIGGANFLSSTKPFLANGRDRFDFYPGAEKIAFAQLPRFNQSFSLEADVEIDGSEASGVLASFGFINKGFSWYFEDGRMVFESREGVSLDLVVTEDKIHLGRHILRIEFECLTCDQPRAFFEPIAGRIRLFVDDELMAEQDLQTVNLTNAGESFAMYIGHARGTRVSDRFEAPNRFNGVLMRLSVILPKP